MAADPALYTHHLGPAARRAVPDPALAAHPPAVLGRGIIFAHAAWSGGSVLKMRLLGETLTAADPAGGLPLVVADLDAVPPGLPAVYGPPDPVCNPLGGWGDLFWVDAGRVVARHTAEVARDPAAAETFLHHTRRLLRADAPD